MLLQQDESIRTLSGVGPLARRSRRGSRLQAVLLQVPAAGSRPQICYRQSGEDNLLIEYGAPTLDLALRFRVQALLDTLSAAQLPGVIDMTPGVRSLQVHFDPRVCSRSRLLKSLLRQEESLPPIDDIEVASRIVHLPLSWDDPATQLAIERYMQSVRADAPWCPSNIEFIRRINGLDSVEDVRRIVFAASYVVMGLGDVYLGAPVATPLDPRHRLVTTKYNPARTWTPENAVGIGGAYLCVYGMEGPGGYQFVGRTLQMWNRYRQTEAFRDGKRWLLRFFDQLRFHSVSAGELERLRVEFPYGKARIDIEPTTLRLRDYRRFLQDNAESISAFKARQQAAFDAERERWRAEPIEPDPPASATDGGALAAALDASVEAPAGSVAISSPVTGSVWQLKTAAGERVAAGDTLLIIEAMKMEVAVNAEQAGTIVELRCQRGQAVAAGETLLWLRLDEEHSA
jgi:urea carboxylase